MKTCKQRRISTVVKNILLFFVSSNGDTQDTHEVQSRGAQISGASTFRRLNCYSVAHTCSLNVPNQRFEARITTNASSTNSCCC
jgi:hypothetical protein